MFPDSSNRWRLRALAGLAFLAPFNVKFTTDAWTNLQVRVLVIVGLAVSLVLAVRSLQVPTWHVPDQVDTLAYGWLLMIWVSAFASDDLALGAGGAVQISVVILLIPACRSVVRSTSDAATILRALGWGTAIGASIGLGIWLWGAELDATLLFVGEVTTLGPINRLTRPWAHANVAAMAMGATAASTTLIRHRWVRLLALSLVVVAIVLTISRGGVVAAGAAALAWVVLRRRADEAKVIAGLVALAAVVFALSSGWRTRIDQLGDDAFYASTLEAPSGLTVGGSNNTVEITVTNLSTRTWPRNGEDRVLISARWLGEDGLIWTEDRWPLPHDLDAGEAVTTALIVVPGVPNGAYTIRWDLLIVDTAYFGQFLGDEPILSAATVVDSSIGPADNFRYDLVERNIDVGRIDTWRLAWDDFRHSPLIGVGPNQFADRDVLERAQVGQVVGAHAHNIVLEPLATWGLLGALPFFILGGGALASAIATARTKHDTVSAVIAVGLIAVVVHGAVDWPLVAVTAGIPVGLLVGLAWSKVGDSSARSAGMMFKCWIKRSN